MISASPRAVRHGAGTPQPGWSVVALVVWTLFVWGGRIRNVVADPALDATTGRTPLLLSATFVVLALVVAGAAFAARRCPDSPRARRSLRVAVAVLAAWTAAVWIVRVVGIVGAGHDLGFVVVHLVLAATSFTLAGAALRGVAAGPPARAHAAGD